MSISRLNYDRVGPLFSNPVVNEAASTGGSFSTITFGPNQYRCAKFTTVGSNTLSVTSGGFADVLLVGGGGTGGATTAGGIGGGGGAGALVIFPIYLYPGNASITVGAAAGASSITVNGATVRAAAGGTGGAYNGAGIQGIGGASSGGAGGFNSIAYGSPTPTGLSDFYSAAYSTSGYNGNAGGTQGSGGNGTGGGGAGGAGSNSGTGGAGVVINGWDASALTLCAGGNHNTNAFQPANSGNGGHSDYSGGTGGKPGGTGLVIVRWRIQ